MDNFINDLILVDDNSKVPKSCDPQDKKSFSDFVQLQDDDSFLEFIKGPPQIGESPQITSTKFTKQFKD